MEIQFFNDFFDFVKKNRPIFKIFKFEIQHVYRKYGPLGHQTDEKQNNVDSNTKSRGCILEGSLGVYRVFHDPYHYQEKNTKSQM